ncbi:helix-turn-helix domain-containing protein [Lacticaseibacillus jixianensis]|uniref:Helix-turn-helix domain-containing protein n=1 Tax=Lacticaseibacillus jixianensis TaxID=2486012 RepID=A0ABW4B9P0_9LACO|nr:helix-turn-helix transcriptional regulator [Lacticaseibacillus jixianensis]
MSEKNSEGIEIKIGLNVKRIRKEQGLTQKELANKLKSIEQTVSKIERGVFTPSAETIMQLCDALNVTPNELMLENPEWQKWQSERLEHQDRSINGLADQISLVQGMFAKADMARDAGDEDKEKAYLDDIIQMYAWQNKDIRAVAEWLNSRYLNEYMDKLQIELRKIIIINAR